MKTIHLPFFFVLLLALLSCEKCLPELRTDPPPVVTCNDSVYNLECELELLPAISTNGQNTFGCLVNGKAWLPNHGVTSKFFVDYYKGIFFFSAARHGYSTWQQNNHALIDYFGIGTSYYNQKGVVTLDNSYNPGWYTNVENSCDYGSKAIISGHLEYLRFDTINWIASGTFEFTTYLPEEENEFNCDTIRVTNGRFDLRIH